MKAIQATETTLNELGFNAENPLMIPAENIDWTSVKRKNAVREGANTPYECKATVQNLRFGEVTLWFPTIWVKRDREEEDIFGSMLQWTWQDATDDYPNGMTAFFTKAGTHDVSFAEAMTQTSNDD